MSRTRLQKSTDSATSPAPITPATQVLADYEHWLLEQYGKTDTYLPHAKSFLKRFRNQGSVNIQLQTFAAQKSITGRSILNRFHQFLIEKKITSIHNDLKVAANAALPKSNIYVKLYLATSKDRLRSSKSLSTYATILNQYFLQIDEIRYVQKLTAQQFIFQKNLSPFTSALYANVLKSFSRWALSYLVTLDTELSISERKIKQALSEISVKSLQDIIHLKIKPTSRKLYYKESLTHRQREKIFNTSKDPAQKAIFALMAYNGLRPVEVQRLQITDFDFRKFTLAIHGKGRTARQKEKIVLFKIVAKAVKGYLKEKKIRTGKLFPNLSYPILHQITKECFQCLGHSIKQQGHLAPHSLRHTAGQLLYNDGVPLEFIQRTLRHRSIESTMVYARKAIEENYFKKLRHHW